MRRVHRTIESRDERASEFRSRSTMLIVSSGLLRYHHPRAEAPPPPTETETAKVRPALRLSSCSMTLDAPRRTLGIAGPMIHLARAQGVKYKCPLITAVASTSRDTRGRLPTKNSSRRLAQASFCWVYRGFSVGAETKLHDPGMAERMKVRENRRCPEGIANRQVHPESATTSNPHDAARPLDQSDRKG